LHSRLEQSLDDGSRLNVDPVHRMKVGLLANHYCALTPAEVLAPAVDRMSDVLFRLFIVTDGSGTSPCCTACYAVCPLQRPIADSSTTFIVDYYTAYRRLKRIHYTMSYYHVILLSFVTVICYYCYMQIFSLVFSRKLSKLYSLSILLDCRST